MARPGTLRAALDHLSGQLQINVDELDAYVALDAEERRRGMLIVGLALVSLLSETRTLLRDLVRQREGKESVDLENPPL